MLFNGFGKRSAKLVLGVVMMVGLLVVLEVFASESGYVREGDVDFWGICNGDEEEPIDRVVRRERDSTNCTDWIEDYMGDEIEIWVDPDRGLDVAIGLFICDFEDCWLVAARDRRFEGGEEHLRYYVDPDDFSFYQIFNTFWVVAVIGIDGRGNYDIEIDVSGSKP